MELHDIFEQIAEARGMVFIYGRTDFQELNEATDNDCGQLYWFCDPIDETPLYSDAGGKTGTKYSGRFMIVQRSEFESNYDSNPGADETENRYEKHLRPIKELIKEELQKDLLCNYSLQVSWTLKEVINLTLSDNFDGILVPFNISSDD